jgi:hypothetical protein
MPCRCMRNGGAATPFLTMALDGGPFNPGTGPWYAWNRTVGRHQSWYGHCGAEINILPVRNKPQQARYTIH